MATNIQKTPEPAAHGAQPASGRPPERFSGTRSTARGTWVEMPADDGFPAAWCYAERMGYHPGETVRLFISSTLPGLALRIWRDGLRRTPVHEASLSTRFQSLPADSYSSGCDWEESYRWDLPADLPPGPYLIELLDPARSDGSALAHHVVFVRPRRGARERIALLLTTSTWTAYNDFGGGSHYRGLIEGYPQGASPILSTRRPWSRGQIWLPDHAPRIVPPRRPANPEPARYDFLEWACANGYSRYCAASGWAGYERHFFRWAEREGYEIDLLTQEDLHLRPEMLDGYRCVAIAGHDEYWTREMRESIEGFVRGGGRVARFAANFMWQIRLEENATRQVCYKYAARDLDPVAGGQDRSRLTSAWEDPLVGYPGARTFGVNGLRGIYAGWGGMAPRASRGFTVFRPDHWAFAGTGLGYADMFGDEAGIFAYEVDGLELTFRDGLPEPLGTDGTPDGLQILAMNWATQAERGVPEHAWSYFIGDRDARLTAMLLDGEVTDATLARRSRGNGVMVSFPLGKGEVLTAASCEWVVGLLHPDPLTQQITRNILDRFLADA